MYNQIKPAPERQKRLALSSDKRVLLQMKLPFAQSSVEYLGHTLSKYGFSKGSKVDAVTQDAIANKCGSTDNFHELSAILHKIPAAISVDNNKAIAQAYQKQPTMEMGQRGMRSV